MRSQNKPHGRSSKETKCKGLYDDTKRRSLESMVGQTTQSRLNSGIKVKIYSAVFLYSEERWFIMTGSRL